MSFLNGFVKNVNGKSNQEDTDEKANYDRGDNTADGADFYGFPDRL